jgi:hypothetical protein
MASELPLDKELLKKVLEPLLEDFQYWFSRARSLLELECLSFLTSEEQIELLERVKKAQQEVSVAQMLFNATNAEVGIESQMLLPWHKLVAECWGVSRQWRLSQNNNSISPNV